jgi:hypothetical protein
MGNSLDQRQVANKITHESTQYRAIQNASRLLFAIKQDQILHANNATNIRIRGLNLLLNTLRSRELHKKPNECPLTTEEIIALKVFGKICTLMEYDDRRKLLLARTISKTLCDKHLTCDEICNKISQFVRMYPRLYRNKSTSRITII